MAFKIVRFVRMVPVRLLQFMYYVSWFSLLQSLYLHPLLPAILFLYLHNFICSLTSNIFSARTQQTLQRKLY